MHEEEIVFNYCSGGLTSSALFFNIFKTDP